MNGRLFISKKDNSKSIFFPIAGYAIDGSVHYSGDRAGVWTSMLNTDDASYGQYLYVGAAETHLGNYGRYYGLCARGVIG